jgi:hypothetical protein
MKNNFYLLLFLIISHSFNSQKHYPGCSGSVSDVIMFDITNSNIYNGKSETNVMTKFDSVERVTLERFIIDRLNYYRKSIGAKELIYDASILPAAYHHALYQRLLSKQIGVMQQTHSENIDIPNFTELDIMGRFALLNKTVHADISEGLIHQGFQIPNKFNEDCPKVTYKKLVDQFFTPGMGYVTSSAHWNDIMNPKWDAICIYYDFEYTEPVTKETFYISANVTLVYAKYK